MSKILHIAIVTCAIFFCVRMAHGQSYDTCARLKTIAYNAPQDESGYQKQYDTLRVFIEHCALSDSLSWRMFSHLDAANQFRSNDTNRYPQYRNWLVSVLNLNKVVPQYFCACMASITSTYQKTLEVLALWNYLRNNHHECWGPPADKQYSQDSAIAAHSGQNPNHLPSMKDLGLDSILNIQNGIQSTTSFYMSHLASVTPNPFTAETTLDFTLNRMTYVTVAVYDELGRWVLGDSHWYSLEA
ncbi:MAG: hypothetical protein WCH46_05055, partial [bacterium]